MLRSLLIMTSSGMVIFSKEFVRGSELNPQMVTMRITALFEIAARATGQPLAHIEFQSVALTCVQNSRARLTCAVLHDAADDFHFCQLLASEILNEFVNEFHFDGAPQQSQVVNQAAYASFQGRILESLRNAVKTIISNLLQNRAVIIAFMTVGDSVLHSSVATGVPPFDPLGAVANLQYLLTVCSDLMTTQRDSANSAVVDGHKGRLYVHRIDPGVIVVVVRKGQDSPKCQASIEHAVAMIRMGNAFMSNLQGHSRQQTALY